MLPLWAALLLVAWLSGWPSAYVAEPTSLYPQTTLVGNFTTPGVKEEIRKHDRLIVQAMAYVSYLTPSMLQEWEPPMQGDPPPLLIQVLMVNRAIPYIDVLFMMLMVGNNPRNLTAFTRVNLLYIERRPEYIPFPRLATLSRIPFVQVHDWSKVKYKSLDHLGWQRKYYMSLLLDYMRALELFLASGSRWCLMLEEDALLPVHFLDLLQHFVLQPLQAWETNLSSVSLFSCYNSANSIGLPQLVLDRWDYGGQQYDADRAKLNVELRAANLAPYRPNFVLRRVSYPVGGVAQLFSRGSSQKFVTYLKQQDLKLCRPLDNLLNMDSRFPAFAGASRLQVEPSLVNHLGFYSSRTKTKIPTWGQMKTDVRFQLDPGPE